MRLLLVTLFVFGCAARPPLMAAGVKQHGMSFACAFDRERDVRYGSAPSAEALRHLKDLGVDWVSIMPFGFQRQTDLRWGGDRVWETDASLVAVTKQAHALGIRVMLKPHVWGRGDPDVQAWSNADWHTWFESYRRFAAHYATIARDAKVDAFCVGNEQKNTVGHESEWRAIIADVRRIYRGPSRTARISTKCSTSLSGMRWIGSV